MMACRNERHRFLHRVHRTTALTVPLPGPNAAQGGPRSDVHRTHLHQLKRVAAQPLDVHRQLSGDIFRSQVQNGVPTRRRPFEQVDRAQGLVQGGRARHRQRRASELAKHGTAETEGVSQ